MKGSALVAGLVAAMAALLVILFVEFKEGGPPGSRGVSVGISQAEAACNERSPQCLPHATLIDTTGQAWTPELLANKVVVVNLWATWCPPCKAEIPDLARVYSRYKSKGVVLLGVVTDDIDDAGLATFMKQLGINYPIVRADDDLIHDFDDPDMLPTTFIYDKRGHMQYGRPGAMSADQLESILDRVLAQSS